MRAWPGCANWALAAWPDFNHWSKWRAARLQMGHNEIVKPARLHFARAARALAGREAFCPNIQPRAHARLTGLTITRQHYYNCHTRASCRFDLLNYQYNPFRATARLARVASHQGALHNSRWLALRRCARARSASHRLNNGLIKIGRARGPKLTAYTRRSYARTRTLL